MDVFLTGGCMFYLLGGWMFYLVVGRIFFYWWVAVCDLLNQLVTDVIKQQQKRKSKILSH